MSKLADSFLTKMTMTFVTGGGGRQQNSLKVWRKEAECVAL